MLSFVVLQIVVFFFKHDIMRPFFCRVQLKEQLTKTEYSLLISNSTLCYAGCIRRTLNTNLKYSYFKLVKL